MSVSRMFRDIVLTLAWPASGAISLAVALDRAAVTTDGLLLVALGTMTAYGLDRLVDQRDRDPAVFRRVLLVCVVLTGLATGLIACASWWRIQVCAILALLAGAYVPLKRIIPKNVLTTTAWTVAVANLPFDGQPHADITFGLAVATVATIIAANTLISDLPDVDVDRRTGVIGIAPHFGPRVAATVALCFGLLGGCLALWAGRWGLSLTAFALSVLALILTRTAPRSVHRTLADGLVIALAGPITILLGGG